MEDHKDISVTFGTALTTVTEIITRKKTLFFIWRLKGKEYQVAVSGSLLIQIHNGLQEGTET